MKNVLSLLLFALVCTAGAQDNPPPPHPPGPPPPHLTAEQKSCMEKKLGKPGEAPRPSKEKMISAFKACGVKPPPKPSEPPPPPPEESSDKD